MFLGQPIGRRLLIDKNPSLTFMIPILVRVFPEIKLLVALRDPRDVVLSCFMLPLVPLNQTAVAYLSLESTVEEYTALMGVWRTVAPLMKNAAISKCATRTWLTIWNPWRDGLSISLGFPGTLPY